MKKLYQKAKQKLSALARISKLKTPAQRKTLINSFINAQFTIALWNGCFVQKDAIKELIKHRRGHSGKFLMTKNHHFLVCFPH